MAEVPFPEGARDGRYSFTKIRFASIANLNTWECRKVVDYGSEILRFIYTTDVLVADGFRVECSCTSSNEPIAPGSPAIQTQQDVTMLFLMSLF